MRPSSSFTPLFFRPTTTANDTPGPSRPTHQQPEPLTYSRENHGDINRFIRSRDFSTFKKEYEDTLDRIAAFVQDNGNRLEPPLLNDTKQKVKNDFNTLKHRLFVSQDFGLSAAVMYGTGKGLFHALEDLLKNENIPLQHRMDDVVALALRTGACAGGLVGDLDATIVKLKLSNGGLEGAAYRWKIKMLDDLILQYVHANNHRCTPIMEIHYVNAYYNYWAHEMGVEARPDENASPLVANGRISLDQLINCKKFVSEQLKPMLLASEMTDQYRDRLEASFRENGIAPDNIPFEKIKVLQDIQKSELDPEYGEVSPHIFLSPIDPNDYGSAYAYNGARWPTGVIRHFLKEFKKQGLADYDNESKIVLGDTGEGRLKMLEGLLWLKVKGEEPKEPTAQDLLKIDPKDLLDAIEKAGPTDAHARASLLRDIVRRIDENYGVFMAMAQGHADVIKTFGELLLPMPPEEQMQMLLNVKDSQGNHGLYAAMAWGHADVIKAFGELLLPMPPEAQVQILLNAIDGQGNHGLTMARQEGHADAIKAFGELFFRLSPEAQMQTLSRVMKDGHADAIKVLGELLLHMPPEAQMQTLSMAMKDGHADIIKGLGELLLRMPPEAQVQILLNAKDSRGNHGLYMAMENGHADVIKALGDLLPPKAQMQILLNAKDSLGNHGLHMAMANGHAEVIKAFGELLLRMPPKAQRQILLNAKDRKGTPGLYTAMVEGHADVIKVLGELVLRMPPKAQRQMLLNVKDTLGNHGFGLSEAMTNGHADVIKAIGELLLLMSSSVQKQMLLNTKDCHGSHGLYAAMQKGHTDVIKAFGELLLRMPPEAQVQILLNAKDRYGTPGLYSAMAWGRANVIKAFGELLLRMPPEAQVQILLNAKNGRGDSGLPDLFTKGNWEALEQYIEIVKQITPTLNLEERKALLSEIQSSHAHKILGWINNFKDYAIIKKDYAILKKDNPDLHSRFKEMEKALAQFDRR